jgi:hypothetical protein
MIFIPIKPMRFQVVAGPAGDLLIEAYGDVYEGQELVLGFDALAAALRHLEFVVHEPMPGEAGPLLPIAFPLLRRWQWLDRSSELSLEQMDAGALGDALSLLPEQARTWRMQWLHAGAAIELVGEPLGAQRDDLWSRVSVPRVDFQSARLELQPDGRLLLSGRLRAINAPPLNRSFDASVACGGVSVSASIDADGGLQAHLQPLPARPAVMRFTISLPVQIDGTPLRIETGDILVQTAFEGAVVAVDDAALAEFAETIPAGRVPVAIRFASSTYRPAETMLTLAARREGRTYNFRLEDTAGSDKYRLLEVDSGIERLLEAQLEVRLDSQETSAGSLAVIPQSLVGRWVAVPGGGYDWHPSRDLPDLGIAFPQSGDVGRPQRVEYRGTRIAVDPTAFEALVPKDPLSALSGDVVALNGTNGRPRAKEYFSVSQKGTVLGSLRRRAVGKYEVPTALRTAMQKKMAVILQSDDGSEQGVLWTPERLPELQSYRSVPLDEIEGAEGQPSLVVFRGIYLPVHVRKLQSSAGGGDHWMIELTSPLLFPQHVQVEPFLPLLMHAGASTPPRVMVWQFGDAETALSVRGDGLLAGPGIGYIFRPRGAAATATEAFDWVAFPPSSDDADVVYCSWRGFLLRFDVRTVEIRFAGWFLPNGEWTYPKRTPFDSYRFARTRKSAAGLLTGSGAAEWTWTECTIPEDDQAAILERVRGSYPQIPKGDADLAHLDATDRDVSTATRRYVLQPSWSPRQKALQIQVSERPSQPSAKPCEAVQFFVERARG